MRTVTFSCVAAVIIATVASSAPAGREQSPSDERRAAAVRAFDHRVDEYAALHRRLEAPVAPARPYRSARAIDLNRAYLAAAIKAARPAARQGDIFGPPVDALLRDLVTRALADENAEEMLLDLFEEHPFTFGFHPRVYHPYPDWATHEMPAILLQHLPALPDDLEYRIVDHDLVLLDIHANLIVDVLPDAVPRPAADETER